MSGSMKIAMVALSASPLPPPLGAEPSSQSLQIAALSRALAACGHEVTVYARQDDPSAPRRVPLADGVDVHHISAGAHAPVATPDLVGAIAAFGQGLTEAFETDAPDVLHAHYWMSGLAALQATRDRSIPVVQAFHSLGSVRRRSEVTGPTSTQRIRMESVIGRAAARVVASCDDESQELRRMGISYQRITVIPPGIDLDLFHPPPSDLEPSKFPRLLTVGPLTEDGGAADQIRALVKLPGARLTVAGGPPADRLDADADAQRLRALADRLGVAHRVRLVGQVPRSCVAELMREVDLFLCTPLMPAFGTVALEAMASGVPVVATAVGGLRDSVVPGVTGELVAPRAPEGLAQAIRRLFHDPVRLQAYRFAASDRARSAFSWQRAAVSTESVYRRVLGLPDAPVVSAGAATQVAS